MRRETPSWATEAEIDFGELARALKLLAHPNRLALLYLLRWPKMLDEIHLTPSASNAGASPDRRISRQAVRGHLEQLKEAGLIRVRSTGRGGRRERQEYVLDPARLFAVVDEMRKLSTFEPTVPLDPFATEDLKHQWGPEWVNGLKLVLIRGVQVGRVFALRDMEVRPSRGWVIGRSREAHVPLEYDHYVSPENTEIIKTGNEYRVLDLRHAKNGTTLNWKRLPLGGEARLENGDVIGVGRSLLLFRAT
ncbi:MAG: FHA domain-containing protein [Euryarchaeota archaeon]|nr:FHA domain-containing protein [Euryarchaeota archaeon]